MSKDIPTKAELTSLDIAEIAKWLDSKNVTSTCLQCGNLSVKIATDDDNLPMITDTYITSNRKMIINKLNNPCYVVFCPNCANQRYFSATVMYLDILSQKEKGEV